MKKSLLTVLATIFVILASVVPALADSPIPTPQPDQVYSLIQHQSTPDLWGAMFTANDSGGATITIVEYRVFDIHGWAVAVNTVRPSTSCVWTPGGPDWQVDNRVTCKGYVLFLPIVSQ